MIAYRNFLVHIDYAENEQDQQAHIIVEVLDGERNEYERTYSAKDFDSLSDKVGDVFYAKFTSMLHTLRCECLEEKYSGKECRENV